MFLPNLSLESLLQIEGRRRAVRPDVEISNLYVGEDAVNLPNIPIEVIRR
jgi:hypothetical protein